TLPSTRCERSPNPVIVGVNTLCPPFCRRSATRRQHQPPCQAPCTSTKVFGAPVCAAAGVPPSAAALAPAPALASTPRRVIAPSLVVVIVSSLRVVARSYLRRVRSSRTARTEKWVGMLGLAALPGHRPPVDNRDNPPPSRQRPAQAYTGRSSESPGQL